MANGTTTPATPFTVTCEASPAWVSEPILATMVAPSVRSEAVSWAASLPVGVVPVSTTETVSASRWRVPARAPAASTKATSKAAPLAAVTERHSVKRRSTSSEKW